VFFTYPVAAVLAHPDWGEVASQTFWPHLLATKAFLFLGVALIGTTISPYMQLYQAAAVADKGIAPDQYRFERVDAIAGAALACLIAFSIIIATGATIGGTGPLSSAAEAARALEPVAGHRAEALFGIGLLGASALAAAVVPPRPSAMDPSSTSRSERRAARPPHSATARTSTSRSESRAGRR